MDSSTVCRSVCLSNCYNVWRVFVWTLFGTSVWTLLVWYILQSLSELCLSICVWTLRSDLICAWTLSVLGLICLLGLYLIGWFHYATILKLSINIIPTSDPIGPLGTLQLLGLLERLGLTSLTTPVVLTTARTSRCVITVARTSWTLHLLGLLGLLQLVGLLGFLQLLRLLGLYICWGILDFTTVPSWLYNC